MSGFALWASLPMGVKMNLGARSPSVRAADGRVTFQIGDGRRRLYAEVTSCGSAVDVALYRRKRVTDERVDVERARVAPGALGEWLIKAHDRAVQ